MCSCLQGGADNSHTSTPTTPWGTTTVRMGGTAPPTTMRGWMMWTQMTRNEMAPTPALWATARRVDCRWHSDDAAPPQLLWATARRLMGMWECLADWMGWQGWKQKAQETLTTSLGPYVSFLFYFLFYFFITRYIHTTTDNNNNMGAPPPSPLLQAPACRVDGWGWGDERQEQWQQEGRTPMTAPTPCLQAAAHRVVCRGDESRWGSKTTRGWLGERWDEWRNRTGMTWWQWQWRNDNGEGRWEGGQVRGKGDDDTGPMKHPQPLPWAIACGVERGAMWVVWAQDGDREMEGKRGTRGWPAPHTTAMSNCSWGGYSMQVHRNNGKWEWGDERCHPVHWWWCKHTLPPLWAADNIPCICEGFFLSILFHLKFVVTAPLPARRGVLLSPQTVLGLCLDS